MIYSGEKSIGYHFFLF
ncbi:hypothetical protein CGLO_13098 [Colletotrichum gloeosporioides Cg-14]|uniref:Uncharacterized protein n=1 Tax=Colletotrichum gloeosporioides (strain Cg-14) TaxID=1237896 RepID=T0K4E5_COLGC|nr:hypothetical protein CGLO_13098 [Colletotrichum gloeosporioides Cg-14]